jgi:hypothetical protein
MPESLFEKVRAFGIGRERGESRFRMKGRMIMVHNEIAICSQNIQVEIRSGSNGIGL